MLTNMVKNELLLVTNVDRMQQKNKSVGCGMRPALV